MGYRLVRRAIVIGLLLGFVTAGSAPAYSVLTHEAAIDVAWEPTIRPLLKSRFPQATQQDLAAARAFAYGGSLIQDLGYYPFGNKFFSNLLHYVRSGDFVEALVRDARTLNELAFAIGALAHYANDNAGHPEAVNRAVPLTFPKLRAKYGDRITYVQAPKQHVIVEFSFDVVQVAAGAYLPDRYRQAIGFEVATDLLERAFEATYHLRMKDLFPDQKRALSTYRYSVSQIIPEITRVAWRDKREEIQKLTPAVQQQAFVFQFRRADFDRQYGRDYQRPGLWARFLGVLYRIVPKVGPLKPLRFTAPTKETEALFARSFEAAGVRFRAALADLRRGRLELANTDFDTGRPARHGEYVLADQTYAKLLDTLAHDAPPALSRALLQNISTYYGRHPEPEASDRRQHKAWVAERRNMATLRISTAN